MSLGVGITTHLEEPRDFRVPRSKLRSDIIYVRGGHPLPIIFGPFPSWGGHKRGNVDDLQARDGILNDGLVES